MFKNGSDISEFRGLDNSKNELQESSEVMIQGQRWNETADMGSVH